MDQSHLPPPFLTAKSGKFSLFWGLYQQISLQFQHSTPTFSQILDPALHITLEQLKQGSATLALMPKRGKKEKKEKILLFWGYTWLQNNKLDKD